MTQRFVIPAAGLHVIDPAVMLPLPVEGKQVSGNDEYWIRRLQDADVSEPEPAPKLPPQEPQQ